MEFIIKIIQSVLFTSILDESEHSFILLNSFWISTKSFIILVEANLMKPNFVISILRIKKYFFLAIKQMGYI